MPRISPKTSESSTKIDFLIQEAIANALKNNWHQAIKINQQILMVRIDDIDSLNRLARAYTCLGKLQNAQKTYKKVLVVDPHNIIAKKNLEKVTKSNGYGKNYNGTNQTADYSRIFLYEPGKTKLVNLINLAPPAILVSLNCGDQLMINAKKHGITITSLDGTYIGALPDDLAHRLLAFIAQGNKYETYIKCTSAKILTVLIKEIYRSAKFINQPSFQTTPIAALE